MKSLHTRSSVARNVLAVLVVILTSIVGVVLLTGSHAATGATLSLSAPSTSVTPGSDFAVTIKEDSGSDPVNSVQASLNYDATQLQYTSISEGGAFGTIAANSTSTPGVIRVGRGVQGAPVTGSNNVVTVHFKVLAANGSVNLSFEKGYSFVVRSTDNSDVLTTTTPATYPVAGTSTASASMSLSPATGSAAAGSTIAVTLRENSGSTAVNSVQASVGYDATKLQYTGLTEGSTFNNVAATDSATAGRVRVARSVLGGSNGVTGDNAVVTLNFKVLATSGSAALTLDKTQSFVVSSSDSKDILATVAGNSYTITSAPSTSSSLSLSPASGTYANGSTVSIVVKATSAAELTTVQSTISYPAAQLQYVSTTEGNVFTTAARTNTATAGTVDIIRGLAGGTTGVTGTNPVVTLNFKVIGGSGSAALAFTNTSALFDGSGTGTNILSLAASTGANFTITGGTVTPPASGNSFSLSPASGSYASGSTVAVTVKAASTTSKLTTVEPVITYPSDKLQYTGITEGGIFTTVLRTNSGTAGTVDIIRGLAGGSNGVTGTNNVVTLNFKVLATTGSIQLGYGPATAMYDDSGSGNNVVTQSSNAGANYTVASNPAPVCSGNPSAPAGLVSTTKTYTAINFSWTASSAAANCALAGYHVYRNGTAVGDVTSGNQFSDSGLTSGTSYSYTVAAFDKAGHVSAASTPVNIATKTDDVAPSTPLSVTAAANSAAAVTIGWAASTDFPNPGGVGVSGYKIYRNGSQTATYTVSSGTTFTDSNVMAGTTYSYVITAYDKLGNESAPSNTVSAKTQTPTPSCTGNPTAPTNLAGSGTLNAANLSWSASTAATSCTLAGYRVFRNNVQVGTVTSLSFNDSGLAPGTSYNYTVQAYDSSGHGSTISTAKTITTAADTTAPAAPGSVTAVAASAGKVDLAWTGSSDNIAVSGYKVYRGGSLVVSLNAAARVFSDTSVQPNNNYSYSVSAIDAAGNESAKTAAVPNPVHTPAATDSQAPTTPTGLSVLTLTPNSVIIAWKASTDNVGVSGYHVFRNGSYIGDATSLSYSSTNLTANTAYTYNVKAFDAAGNTSSASGNLVFTTPKPVVNLVGDLNADGSVDILDLSIMLTHWKEVNVPARFGDLNGDGSVELSDLSILLSHFGEKS